MFLSVLTGDIVDSTKLSATALDLAMQALSEAAHDIGQWDRAPSLFGRRGGDGWQLALGAPSFGLRAALFLQASLRRQDKTLSSRIALAHGVGDLPGSGDVNGAHGDVFVASGRLLEQISGHSRMAHAQNDLFDAVTALADEISQGWTQAQARSLYEVLSPTQEPRAAVAKRLGISRPAVNQALWGAGYPALQHALERWEHDPIWQEIRK